MASIEVVHEDSSKRVLVVKLGVHQGNNCFGATNTDSVHIQFNDNEALDQSVGIHFGDIDHERVKGTMVSGVRVRPGWSFNGGAHGDDRAYFQISTGLVGPITGLVPTGAIRSVSVSAVAKVPNDCFGPGNWANGEVELHLKRY